MDTSLLTTITHEQPHTLEPKVTPEQLVRNMGGYIQHYQFYTVAELRSMKDTLLFIQWLVAHKHEYFHANRALTVAYRCPVAKARN